MHRLIARSPQSTRLSSSGTLLRNLRSHGPALRQGHGSPFSHDKACGKRSFHITASTCAVKPFILADIGEGITECQITEWFVGPGDKVEQFDRICEAQSDKATVEITSRFDGTITKLHYETDDTAIVGKPLVDIDVEGEADTEEKSPASSEEPPELILDNVNTSVDPAIETKDEVSTQPIPEPLVADTIPERKSKPLLSPAVRHHLRSLSIDPSLVTGSGKDGRITKEDVQNYVRERESSTQVQEEASTPSTISQKPPPSSTLSSQPSSAADEVITLTAIENQMFQVMTKSLAIPQFLYTNSVDVSGLNKLRKHANAVAVATKESQPKLTTLPFILKALSQTLLSFPKLNAHLDPGDGSSSSRPKLTLKSSHNFGIAVDTPQGLLVPIVKNVEKHSVVSLAAEISRLGDVAKAGKLQPSDFKDGTFIVSNIGSIGGNVVSPVIVTPMVGIIGVGRSHTVPSFDDAGNVVPREQATFSWSADHRVLDGATVARCAEALRQALENIELLGTSLR